MLGNLFPPKHRPGAIVINGGCRGNWGQKWVETFNQRWDENNYGTIFKWERKLPSWQEATELLAFVLICTLIVFILSTSGAVFPSNPSGKVLWQSFYWLWNKFTIVFNFFGFWLSSTGNDRRMWILMDFFYSQRWRLHNSLVQIASLAVTVRLVVDVIASKKTTSARIIYLSLLIHRHSPWRWKAWLVISLIGINFLIAIERARRL